MIHLKKYGTREYLLSSILFLVPCTACWLWREPLWNTGMSAFAKIGNVISCNWLRYTPQDDQEEYGDLLQRSVIKDSISSEGGVANAIAKFEHGISIPSTPTKKKANSDEDKQLPTCSQKAWKGASTFFGLFWWRKGEESQSSKSKSSPRNITPTKYPNCAVCRRKIFPTEETFSCRNSTYHTACFRCTQCGSKLKNHPDEIHKVAREIFLQCTRCKINSDVKGKPIHVAKVAGEKIEVLENEQGDIEKVVDDIGDDLEDAMYGLVPCCATCGGDFLKYKGEVCGVGSGMKYHKECWLYGKPALGLKPSMTLLPVQAAKYLPESLIVRLSLIEGRVITTLYFMWKNREVALKKLRSNIKARSGKKIKEPVTVSFELDESAHANPNFRGKKHSPTKTKATLSSQTLTIDNQQMSDLSLSLVGGDQIAPQSPSMIEPASIEYESGYQNLPFLKAMVRYTKYNLQHTLLLKIPCDVTCQEINLLAANLTVTIQEACESSDESQLPPV